MTHLEDQPDLPSRLAKEAVATLSGASIRSCTPEQELGRHVELVTDNDLWETLEHRHPMILPRHVSGLFNEF